MTGRVTKADRERVDQIQEAIRKALEGFMGEEKWRLLAIDVRALVSGGPMVDGVRDAIPLHSTLAMSDEDYAAILAVDFSQDHAEATGVITHDLPARN